MVEKRHGRTLRQPSAFSAYMHELKSVITAEQTLAAATAHARCSYSELVNNFFQIIGTMPYMLTMFSAHVRRRITDRFSRRISGISTSALCYNPSRGRVVLLHVYSCAQQF